MFKVTASLRFLSLTARGYVQPLTMEHCGSVHYITIGDSRLLTAARPHMESIIFNRGRSVAMMTFTDRVFHPAQRPPPVERAPA